MKNLTPVKHPFSVYNDRAAAEKMAARVQADDDSWSYRVFGRNDGRYVIDIHDEDGSRVGCL